MSDDKQNVPPPAMEDNPPPRSRTNVPPQPHELTAEWTVRAQLKFARAGESVRKEYNSSSGGDPAVNPVRVIYKWSALNSDDDEGEDDTSNKTRQSTPLKHQQHSSNVKQESFHSTTSSTNPDYGGGDSAFSGSNTSRKYRSHHESRKRGGTSTTGVADDEPPPVVHYGTRCRSTCNIVVSAVADFLPPSSSSNNTSFSGGGGGGGGAAPAANSSYHQFIPEEPDPFVFNTTACYTVLPEKSVDDPNLASKNFSAVGKILALRDAFSQTSDTETKYFESCYSSQRSPMDIDRRFIEDDEDAHRRRQTQQQLRKSHDHHRRTTAMDSLPLLPPTMTTTAMFVDEANSFTPSYSPSPTQTMKSASLPMIPPLPAPHHSQQLQQTQQQQKNTGEPQKKPPRTVHIDVYCTGSDEDDPDADNNSSSASSSSSSRQSSEANMHDIESNSTPQTVLNTEQMVLRHKRVSGKGLPRRLILSQEQKSPSSVEAPSQQQQQQQKQQPQTPTSALRSELNLGHAITKSSTAEEVCESKQLLFRKHIGDQRAVKLQNLRNKYLRKDPSTDDCCLSSNYPNSSRSTMRDATCSSISSAVPSSHIDQDSSWKETTEDADVVSCSLTKSDSFDYDNSVDRLRIKQMERFWSQAAEGNDVVDAASITTYTPMRSHTQPTFLHPISEVNSQRNSPFHAALTTITTTGGCETLPSESEIFSESDLFYPYHQLVGAPAPNLHPPFPDAAQTYPPRMSASANLNRPGFLHFFGPQAAAHSQMSTTAQHHYYRPSLQRWKSESRDNFPETPSSVSEDTNTSNSPAKRCGSEARSPEKKLDFPPTVSSAISGYTSEYLEKAMKFGSVLQTVRKPGHHVGPTKNPSCLCESCQRWMAERFQLRARTFSLGDRPPTKY